MKRVTVTKRDLEENSHAAWNAFVQLLAMTAYEDLAPSQRLAHLVFWYESEVQNGGHLQYFLNQGDARGEETIQSLHALGAHDHAHVLDRALARWRLAAQPIPADADEYLALVLESEFDELDQTFQACPTPLIDALKRHFAQREADFVEKD